HTATQYALLTALAAFGRTYMSAGAGFIAAAAGWGWFFAICAAAGLPGLVLLAWLQQRGHFAALARKPAAEAEGFDWFVASERCAALDRRRECALVEIVDPAADRNAVGEPRHLHLRSGEQVGDVVRAAAGLPGLVLLAWLQWRGISPSLARSAS